MFQTIRNFFSRKSTNDTKAPSLCFGDPRVVQFMADAPIQSQEVVDEDEDIFFQGRYLSDYPSVDVLYEENRKPSYLIQKYHLTKLKEQEEKSYEPPNELGKITRWD